MAGLPNFATYFGRDMMMTALMMRAIWSPTMAEHVIASVLRKLSADGEVSHEEALGGQAIREHAAECNGILAAYRRGAGQSAARATACSGSRARCSRRCTSPARTTTCWTTSSSSRCWWRAISRTPRFRRRGSGPSCSATATAMRRAFRGWRAAARAGAGRAAITRPYASSPGHQPGRLRPAGRDHWRSSSWRDSDAGYANGRFAMDINAIWAPRALEAHRRHSGRAPGARRVPDHTRLAGAGHGGRRSASGSGIPARSRGDDRVDAAPSGISALRSRRRDPRVESARRLATMPPADRAGGPRLWRETPGYRDSLRFLALALDSAGKPIAVVNTDPATVCSSARRRRAAGYRTGGDRSCSYGPIRPGCWCRGSARWSPTTRTRRRPCGRRSTATPTTGRGRVGPRGEPSAPRPRRPDCRLVRLRRPLSRPRARPPYAPRSALRRILAAVEASGVEHGELLELPDRGRTLPPTRYGSGSDVAAVWSMHRPRRAVRPLAC